MKTALALAIGANVGTTITAILGAIGANAAGKRLAAAHLVFNVVTGVTALVFIQLLLAAVDGLGNLLGIAADNHTLKLALFHSLFNLIGIALMLPLLDLLVSRLELYLGDNGAGRDRPRYLSAASLELPQVAVQAITKETRHLFSNAFTPHRARCQPAPRSHNQHK